MATDDRPDEDLARELLGLLHDDQSDPAPELPDRTIRKVQAELTGRDLIDLTTFVFLMRFCAPLLDLIAAFFGHDPIDSRDRTFSEEPEDDQTLHSPRHSRTSNDRRPDDE